MKERLYGKTLAQLRDIASELAMPRHAAGQMAAWLYKRGVDDIAAMTDISAARRALLAERFEIGLSAPLRETVSADGTKKYLFEAGVCESNKGVAEVAVSANSELSVSTARNLFGLDRPYGTRDERLGDTTRSSPPEADKDREAVVNTFVEAAMIPDNGRDGERATLCLSSQAGCRMGCAFCATGRQGLQYNLSTGDILNQFASLPERDALTNIVYMGMGEPLDNLDAVLRSLEILTSEWGYGWSPTRITVSTGGIASKLERFLAESRVHLAVSLHNPFSDERAAIMPIERAYPIEGIVETLRRYFARGNNNSGGSHQRRISFEYIVMSGLNDSPRHIAGLTKLLGGLSCRVNLIKFHRLPGSPFFSPPAGEMERFRDALTRKGIRTTIRASRGEDIEAACGLLSTKELAAKSHR